MRESHRRPAEDDRAATNTSSPSRLYGLPRPELSSSACPSSAPQSATPTPSITSASSVLLPLPVAPAPARRLRPPPPYSLLVVNLVVAHDNLEARRGGGEQQSCTNVMPAPRGGIRWRRVNERPRQTPRLSWRTKRSVVSFDCSLRRTRSFSATANPNISHNHRPAAPQRRQAQARPLGESLQHRLSQANTAPNTRLIPNLNFADKSTCLPQILSSAQLISSTSTSHPFTLGWGCSS